VKYIVALLCLFAFCSTTQAQSTPVVEVFGGATWLHANISPELQPYGLASINGIGWDGSATENVNSWFGGTLDMSGAYARPTITIAANTFGPGIPATKETYTNLINTSAYTFTYGPTFSYRRLSKVVMFGRVLLGDEYAHASTTSKGAAFIGAEEKGSTGNHFAVIAGGGAEFAVSPMVALRVTADWVLTTVPDGNIDRQNNLRIAGGFVLQFGTTKH
jgi:hypothetical protein